MAQAKRIEYMCTYCGTRTTRAVTMGRPSPGSCSKKPKDSTGRHKPHSWVISRKFY